MNVQKKHLLIIGSIIIVAIMGIVTISLSHKQENKSIQKSYTQEWIEISVFCQCCEEPWEDDTNIKSFFKDKGINIYDIKIRSRGAVCEACNCPSYNIKEILIDTTDKEKVLEILNNHKE